MALLSAVLHISRFSSDEAPGDAASQTVFRRFVRITWWPPSSGRKWDRPLGEAAVTSKLSAVLTADSKRGSCRLQSAGCGRVGRGGEETTARRHVLGGTLQASRKRLVQ